MPATVVAPIDQPVPELQLVELVDFKWLMAGEGHRIDVGRLQADSAYARGCLAVAGGSTTPALRHSAQRLGQALALAPRHPA